jgi:MoxR-like ATPase
MNVWEVKDVCTKILDGINTYFVGNRFMLRKLLAASLANGHILFEDFPGLGKTLLAKCFAKVTGCVWGRVQFTPDLMAADILGTRVWRMAESKFVLEKGPIFTNMLLADEINRSPPKTQSALLEAMEERQVTIEGETHRLSAPFFVIATQNPIELEGTYPLPEAQMDRFLLKLSMGYVQTKEEESQILKRRISWRRDDPTDLVKPVTDQALFVAMQQFIETEIYVDDQIVDYISDVVRLTRGSRRHLGAELRHPGRRKDVRERRPGPQDDHEDGVRHRGNLQRRLSPQGDPGPGRGAQAVRRERVIVRCSPGTPRSSS